GSFELHLAVPGGRLNRDGEVWTVTERERLTWEGPLPLADGSTAAGVATALTLASGGRVDALTDDGIELVSCWDAAGAALWEREDGVDLVGSAALCPVPGPE